MQLSENMLLLFIGELYVQHWQTTIHN